MVLVAAALALTAACGGSSDTRTGPEASGSPASSAVLTVVDSPLGRVLADDRGRTVYVFANDADGSSTCTGVCARNWPPVEAPDPLPGAVPGVTGTLGETTRADGSSQLTVANHPVYMFAGDSAPGQTNGQGSTLDGGLWTVVSPAGSPLTGAGPGSPSPTGGPGGYGY